ncbi:MAG: hypothetical protein R3A10_14395 [Caldilineaceae bacterium]
MWPLLLLPLFLVNQLLTPHPVWMVLDPLHRGHLRRGLLVGTSPRHVH